MPQYSLRMKPYVCVNYKIGKSLFLDASKVPFGKACTRPTLILILKRISLFPMTSKSEFSTPWAVLAKSGATF